jgi:hypothetical protein
VLVRTRAELARVVATNPFPAAAARPRSTPGDLPRPEPDPRPDRPARPRPVRTRRVSIRSRRGLRLVPRGGILASKLTDAVWDAAAGSNGDFAQLEHSHAAGGRGGFLASRGLASRFGPAPEWPASRARPSGPHRAAPTKALAPLSAVPPSIMSDLEE